MIGRIRKRLSPETADFDQFLNGITGKSSQSRPPASNDLERFATWVQDSPQSEPAQSQESAQVLNRLLAAQQDYIDSHARTNMVAASESGASGGARRRFRENDPRPGQNPNPVFGGLLPGERGGVVANNSSMHPKWAHLPTYLAGTGLLLVVSVTLLVFFFNTDVSNNAGSPNHPAVAFLTPRLTGTSVAVDPRPIVIIDGVAMTIMSWELKEAIDTAFADELPIRGEFLVLQVTLTNRRGITNQDAPFKSLLVVDGENKEYLIDNYATVLANDAIAGTESLSNISLESGVEHVVYLVFDVPIESTSFQLTDPARSFVLPIVGP